MEIDGPMRASKRRASDDHENDQRLTKKLRLLSLKNDGTSQRWNAPPPPRQASADDSMHLDDTKDKVYIHDLDRELESVESPEDTIAFLPEIEKRFTTIPQSVLSGSGSSKGQEIVLYQVPSSITVPEEQDSVRRAIIETRARARAKKVEEEAPATGSTMSEDPAVPVANGYMDFDEMDIG